MKRRRPRLVVAMTAAAGFVLFLSSACVGGGLGGGGIRCAQSKTDHGVCVTNLHTGIGLTLGSIAIDPLHPQSVYVMTNDVPIYRSTDGGVSWGSFQLPTDWAPETIAFTPRRPETVYAGTWGGIYRSTDGGSSWTPAGLVRGCRNALPDSSCDVQEIAIAPNGRVLYAGVLSCTAASSPEGCYYSGPGLFISRDAGASWVADGFKGQSVSLTLDPRRPDNVYVSADAGLFKSMNGGASWKKLASLPKSADVPVFDPRNPQVLYVDAFGHLLFKSTDGGASWTKLRGRLPENIESVFIDPYPPHDLYAETSNAVADSKLFQSTDGGLSWRDSDLGGGGWATNVVFGPEAAYVGTFNGVFEKTNTATVWRRLAARGTQVNAVAVSANGQTLYASADSGSLSDSGRLYTITLNGQH
jgi:photosystem II stability/assembly factor-like uncharacterized protein